MRAKPCLPPCTDARGPLCLELINGEGKLCEPRDGPTACSALRSCGSDCANQWLSPMQLFRSITWRHHWVLFVGDSDTRGLIIGLLQLLATAGYGAELWHRTLERCGWAVPITTRKRQWTKRAGCATSTSRTMLMLGS